MDWEQQEFGIAAALSGDPLMMEAYRSGDPYLAFAKQAGAVPADATKATHKAVREQYKAWCWRLLSTGSAPGTCRRIGQPPIHARELFGCTGKPIVYSGLVGSGKSTSRC